VIINSGIVVKLNFDAHTELKATIYKTYLKFTFFQQWIISSHLLFNELVEFLYKLSLMFLSLLYHSALGLWGI